MSRLNNPEAKVHSPEQIRRLIRATERRDQLQSQIDALSEDLVCNIIEGFSTGDDVLDFAITACNGDYNPYIAYVRYPRLHDLGLRRCGQQVLIVQQAEFTQGSEWISPRRVHLAVLRPDFTKFFVDSLVCKIPVESHYYTWTEFYTEGYLVPGSKISPQEWLTVGPLYNEYSNYEAAYKDDGGVVFAPESAVCNIYPWPLEDPELLMENNSLDQRDLDSFFENWIRMKSEICY